MNDRFLMILEVSQKQAYIFKEKKLKNNILASEIIDYVMSSAFFSEQFGDVYEEKKNLVYSGGGHTFLIFDSKDEAQGFAKKLSRYVLQTFPGLELFIRIREYDIKKSPTENIRELTNELEKKKGIRKSFFHQATFGIENAGHRMAGDDEDLDKNIGKDVPAKIKSYVQKKAELEMDGKQVNIEKMPEGYTSTNVFEKLGGIKGKNNFIAVVHIDGNQMGSRVLGLTKVIEEDKAGIRQAMKQECPEMSKERLDFEVWRYYSRKFSESIDFDFKKALQSVYEELSYTLKKDSEATKALDLSVDEEQGLVYFPLRKIIAAGDDICFVTAGQVGLECAERFIYHLEKQRNAVDGKEYHACAGVAIVHQKYPFYRAYELAEELCKNAKKKMAERVNILNADMSGKVTIETGGLSAIDWHVEYGELVGDLEQIRENMKSLDGTSMYERPYQITRFKDRPEIKPYESYRNLVRMLQKKTVQNGETIKSARSKQKEMRNAIKNGAESYDYYLKVNRMEESFREYSLGEAFDAIETEDIFFSLKRGAES